MDNSAVVCFLFVVNVKPSRKAGSCFAFNLRKPFLASFMAAAIQRNAIKGELQPFTLRVTRHTVPTDSLTIDPERRHQHEMLSDVDAVDLHDMMSSLGRSAPVPASMRVADNATKCREAADFDTPAPACAGTSPSGSRTARRLGGISASTR